MSCKHTNLRYEAEIIDTPDNIAGPIDHHIICCDCGEDLGIEMCDDGDGDSHCNYCGSCTHTGEVQYEYDYTAYDGVMHQHIVICMNCNKVISGMPCEDFDSDGFCDFCYHEMDSMIITTCPFCGMPECNGECQLGSGCPICGMPECNGECVLSDGDS